MLSYGNPFLQIPIMKNSNKYISTLTLLLSGIFPSQTFGQDYRGQNISTLNLAGQDLSAAQFDSTTIFSQAGTGVNLSGTNAVLSGISGSVNFGGVNLASVSFQGSDLSAATFDAQTVFSHFDPGTGQQQGVNLSGTNAVLSGLSGPPLTSGRRKPCKCVISRVPTSLPGPPLMRKLFSHTSTQAQGNSKVLTFLAPMPCSQASPVPR